MTDIEFKRYCGLIDGGGRVNIYGWNADDVERLMKHYDSKTSIIANRDGIWFKKWTPPKDISEYFAPPSLKEQFKQAPIRTLLSLLIVMGHRHDIARIFNNLSHRD